MDDKKKEIAELKKVLDQWVYPGKTHNRDRHVLATVIHDAGYRLDPYPNGKSKGELIARIETVEAERDKTRNLLRAEHELTLRSTWANSKMDNETFESWRKRHSCVVCTFLAETSSVKL